MGSVPGTTTNVLLEEETTTEVSVSYNDISEETNSEYKTIYRSDDDLFNVWFGIGGELFNSIANVIEHKLENLKTKSSNMAKYYGDAVVNFSNNDEARADSSIVDTSDGSSEEGGN